MFTKRIKITAITALLILGTIGIVNGFNSDDKKEATVAKECANKDAAQCAHSATEASAATCANKTEANAEVKSCCKNAQAKACEAKVEKTSSPL